MKDGREHVLTCLHNAHAELKAHWTKSFLKVNLASALPESFAHLKDRGIQYASGEYVAILKRHEMMPSMSRPANSYDNVSCESFIKTLIPSGVLRGKIWAID